MVSEFNNIEKAEFNGAFDYLARLNGLFSASIIYSKNLDMFNWFHVLIQIFKELSTEMTAAEIDATNNEIFAINSSYNLQPAKTIDFDLYKRLHGLELKLRQVYNKSGLQMKRAENPEGALR